MSNENPDVHEIEVGGEKFLRDIRSAIRFRISELFETNGIVIAFPQRDVHLDTKDALEIRVLHSDQPVPKKKDQRDD